MLGSDHALCLFRERRRDDHHVRGGAQVAQIWAEQRSALNRRFALFTARACMAAAAAVVVVVAAAAVVAVVGTVVVGA